MTIIRLFGNDIKVAEEKSIMLFGKRIFPHAALNNNISLIDIPDLSPPNMGMAIQGSRPVYIGWKYVANSDVKVNLSRFLIPIECCTKILHYMSRSEREKIVNEGDTGLNVSVMDPKGNLHAMKFTRWKSLGRLVFNRGWNKLVVDNHLQKGDLLHLWHFRTPSNKPCFAINTI